MTRLKGKTALITGGGSGLGEAMATLFAREGAQVVIADIQQEKSRAVVAAIEREGGTATFIPTDVTVEAEVRATVATTLRTYGRIDVLVNDAGSLFHAGPLHETSDDIWNRSLDVFLTGSFRFMRAVIPHMLERKGGSILNISSVGGMRAIAGYPCHAYAAAKAGVIALTKTVAIEYATQGIRVNCICPSGVVTPGIAAYTGDQQMTDYMATIHPMGLGKPEYIANAAVYFASDESIWTTGTVLPVDGGFAAI